MKGKGCINILISAGILSIILGIVFKTLWYMGIIAFLPFGIRPISYIAFSSSLFLLAISLSVEKLLSKNE